MQGGYHAVPFVRRFVLWSPIFFIGRNETIIMITLAQIPHLPVTLANEAKVREHYDRVRTYCQSHGVQQMVRTIARLRGNDPVLRDLIDEVGQPSAAWLERHTTMMLDNDVAERQYTNEQREAMGQTPLDSPALTKEQAAEIVKKDHAERMRQYFAVNPEAARQMYFDFGAFPATLDALKVGRGIILGCADWDAVAGKHGAENANVWQDENGECWQTVTATEVAEWVNRFCEAWQ